MSQSPTPTLSALVHISEALKIIDRRLNRLEYHVLGTAFEGRPELSETLRETVECHGRRLDAIVPVVNAIFNNQQNGRRIADD